MRLTPGMRKGRLNELNFNYMRQIRKPFWRGCQKEMFYFVTWLGCVWNLTYSLVCICMKKKLCVLCVCMRLSDLQLVMFFSLYSKFSHWWTYCTFSACFTYSQLVKCANPFTVISMSTIEGGVIYFLPCTVLSRLHLALCISSSCLKMHYEENVFCFVF